MLSKAILIKALKLEIYNIKAKIVNITNKYKYLDISRFELKIKLFIFFSNSFTYKFILNNSILSPQRYGLFIL